MHIYKATKSLILVDIHLKAIKLNSPILGEKCPKPPKSHPPPPPSALYPTTPLEITHEYVYTLMAHSYFHMNMAHVTYPIPMSTTQQTSFKYILKA